MSEVEARLQNAGITPTPVRILVFRCLYESTKPMSLAEIETKLESVDKSTISRTLSTFRGFHLIHSFYDGSGSMKYEICHSHNHENDEDNHVHFRCKKCGETQCFADIKIPKVELPEGFVVEDASFIMSGLCKDCSETDN